MGLGLYLVLINLYGWLVMAIDKRKAMQGHWRISERHLWLAAWCGGALGVLIGMKLFRHKTRHTSFRIGVPFLNMGHLVLWGMVFLRIL
nr:DUF1294 domain-containing protein [Pullulanibacillus camelliae]